MASLIRGLYSAGLEIPVLAFGGGATEAINELVSTSAPIPFYAVTPLAGPLDKEEIEEIVQKVKAYDSNIPINVWKVQSYAAANAFVNVLKTLDSTPTTDELIAALENMDYGKW